MTGESGLERFKTKKHSVFHAATNYRTQLKSNQKNIVLSGTHIQEFSALLYHTRKSWKCTMWLDLCVVTIFQIFFSFRGFNYDYENNIKLVNFIFNLLKYFKITFKYVYEKVTFKNVPQLVHKTIKCVFQYSSSLPPPFLFLIHTNTITTIINIYPALIIWSTY